FALTQRETAVSGGRGRHDQRTVLDPAYDGYRRTGHAGLLRRFQLQAVPDLDPHIIETVLDLCIRRRRSFGRRIRRGLLLGRRGSGGGRSWIDWGRLAGGCGGWCFAPFCLWLLGGRGVHGHLLSAARSVNFRAKRAVKQSLLRAVSFG